MSTDYYVRSRGKISGPFDLAALQKMVQRGTLSRAHELSSDRAAWMVAGEYEELFPARGSRPSDLPTPHGAVANQQRGGGDLYHYVQNGATVGPVPLSVLISLAQNGTLGADDVCWPDGAQISTPAFQLPALAPIFSSGMRRPIAGHQAHAISDADRVRARQVLGSISVVCQIAGIVIGSIMLLFLHLPIWSANGETLWWWDVLRYRDSGPFAVPLFFILFAAIGAGVVGGALRGLVRAWIFLGISALSLVLFLGTGIGQTPINGAILLFGLVVPYIASALIGVSLFRDKVPQARIAAIFQAIFGGGLLFSVLIVMLLAEILGLPHDCAAAIRARIDNPQLPEWAVLAGTVATVGGVVAIVAGVVGLVGSRPTFSRGVNWTTIGCALGAILLLFLASTTAGFGIAKLSQTDKVGLFVFGVFRFCAIFCSFVVLSTFGLLELFAVLCLPQARKDR